MQKSKREAVEEAVGLFGEHFNLENVEPGLDSVSFEIPLTLDNWVELGNLPAVGSVLDHADAGVVEAMLSTLDGFAGRYGNHGMGDEIAEFRRSVREDRHDGWRMACAGKFDALMDGYSECLSDEESITDDEDEAPFFYADNMPYLTVELGLGGSFRVSDSVDGRELFRADNFLHVGDAVDKAFPGVFPPAPKTGDEPGGPR